MAKNETSEERWELPEPLRVTPEMLAEIDRADREALARGQSPFLALSPQERERARAIQIAAEYEQALEHLDSLIKQGAKRKWPTGRQKKELAAAREARPAVAAQLAEAYAASGRFDLAAEAHPDRKQKADYLRVWRAVFRDDAHWCDCPKPLSGGTHTFVRQDIFSVKHDRFMPLLRCSNCKCLNVAPMPKEIVEQRAHRATAAQLVRGMKPDDAKRELIRRGHVAKELLK